MLLYLCFISALALASESRQPPNIVFILADDLGFNDIGYHNSEIKTPVLDKLAEEGVTLENYYVQPICTPTRSTLLTGRYQIHTGLQHGIIWSAQPNCVPLEDITIAQKLKESGYRTHAVGKWHNGFYKKECTPTYRGFDSFFGYLSGAEDYSTHISPFGFPALPYMSWSGYDFWRDDAVTTEGKGNYSTFLFGREAQKIVEEHDKISPLFLYLAFQAVHSPLEVPDKYLKQYQHIKDKNRRIYSGMVSAMDEAVGNVTRTLKNRGLWNNTILIFSTDNGGCHRYGGNNWPLRGHKRGLWEGGTRGVGFVNSPLLQKPARVSHEMFHVSDWFPTLLSLASGELNGTRPLDGYDIWETINTGAASPRTEILHNIDPVETPWDSVHFQPYKWCPHAALRVGDWKLLTGCPGDPNWYPPPSSDLKVENVPTFEYENKKIYLFNIANDPEERHELSAEYPDKVMELLARLEVYNSTSVPVRYPPPDPAANPALHDGMWVPWEDKLNEYQNQSLYYK